MHDLQPDISVDPHIVVDSLGFLEDPFGSRPSDGSPASPATVAAALAAGLTATNLTIAHGSDFDDTLRAIRAHDALIDAYPDVLLKVRSTKDINQAAAEGKVGLIFGLQNAAMVSNIAQIDLLADKGVRIIQLTYNRATPLGDGALSPHNAGMTAFGREIVRRLNERKVVVDLSHSGDQLCLDAMDVTATATPICITHTGCQSLADHPRNKADSTLRAIADRGGYIGIYAMPYLAPGRQVDSSDIIAHLDHAINTCGEDSVGFGSDHGVARLRGVTERRESYRAQILERRRQAISAPGEDPDLLPYAEGLAGPDKYRTLARRLTEHGYRSARIEKLLGGNFLRYLESIWDF